MEQLRTVLSTLKARGVFIIAYSPPLLTDWARIISTTPKEKEFWREYHEQLPELFRSLDIPFWDIVTPETIGLSDRFMRDPYHAHETFDVHLLQLFCQDERVRQLFPETPKITQEALASPRTNSLYPDLPGDQSPAKIASPREWRARYLTVISPSRIGGESKADCKSSGHWPAAMRFWRDRRKQLPLSMSLRADRARR